MTASGRLAGRGGWGTESTGAGISADKRIGSGYGGRRATEGSSRSGASAAAVGQESGGRGVSRGMVYVFLKGSWCENRLCRRLDPGLSSGRDRAWGAEEPERSGSSAGRAFSCEGRRSGTRRWRLRRGAGGISGGRTVFLQSGLSCAKCGARGRFLFGAWGGGCVGRGGQAISQRRAGGRERWGVLEQGGGMVG